MKPIFLVYTFQDAEHLAELIDALAPYEVLVHVDAKVDVADFAAVIGSRKNARMIEPRFRVNWGGYSQVRAIRALVQEALLDANDDDYLIMLSGSDYPLRPISELLSHLRSSRAVQYLRAFEIAGTDPKYTRQIDRRHHRDTAFLARWTRVRALRKVRNAVIKAWDGPLSTRRVPPPPDELRVGHGGTHFAVTAECMRAMEALVTPEVEHYFEGVFCPEEKFYQSLIMNTPFATATPAGGFEEYVGPGNWRYANLHLIDPTLVRVFTLDDWSEIEQSDQFFIRKIVSGPSTSLRARLRADRLTG